MSDSQKRSSLRSAIDGILSTTLTLCAVAVAVSVVYRTFIQPSGPPEALPAKVANWEEAAKIGYRFGDAKAPITIVEVADLQCPACRGFQPAVRAALKDFPGRVTVLHVPTPLSYHPHAMPAARAAECANDRSRIWEWVEVVYEKQDSLGKKSWGSFALDAGIKDSAAISKCALGTATLGRVVAAQAYGERVGATGTPTVIINGWRLPSPPSAETLKRAIEALERGENPFQKSQWRALMKPPAAKGD